MASYAGVNPEEFSVRGYTRYLVPKNLKGVILGSPKMSSVVSEADIDRDCGAVQPSLSNCFTASCSFATLSTSFHLVTHASFRSAQSSAVGGFALIDLIIV